MTYSKQFRSGPVADDRAQRQRLVDWVLSMMDNTDLGLGSDKREVLNQFVDGQLSLDEMLNVMNEAQQASPR